MPRASKGTHISPKVIGPKTDDGKDPAAVALGRKGGKARAENLTAKERSEIAKKAAQKRWAK
jgi:hypothetical protein